MTDFKPLREIIREEMRSQGITVSRLSELTDVAPHYLKALLENNLSALPAAPYVRGYLEAIAQALSIDSEPLWQEYQKEAGVKRSGALDRLPLNRYAQKPFNKTALIITVLVLVVLAFLVPQIADFFGKPGIEVTSPAADRYTVSQDTFTVRGKIKDPQDKLLINESEIVVGSDGTFSKDIPLDPGCNNTVNFVVKRFLGLNTTVTRNICYEPPAPAPLSPTTTPSSILPASQ